MWEIFLLLFITLLSGCLQSFKSLQLSQQRGSWEINMPRGDRTSRPRGSSMRQRVLPTRRGESPCVEKPTKLRLFPMAQTINWYATADLINRGPKCGLLAPASGRWSCRAPILSTPMRRLWSPGSFHDLPSPLQWAFAFCFVLCCMIFSATRGMSVALLLDFRSTVLSSALAFTAAICRDAALITSDETRTLRKLFCSLS